MSLMRLASVTIIGFLLLTAQAGAFCFDEAGMGYGINPGLLRCIAQVESKMDASALNLNRNGTTDIGLMQINSWWLRVLGLDRQELIANPCYNVKTGAWILKQCMARYGYTWEAVGCYNAYSKDKKVIYSWKIFNELKKDALDHKKLDHKKVVINEKPVLEQKRRITELRFTVKDISPSYAGEER